MNYFDILWSQHFGAGGFTPHERSMLKALTENPENHNGIYRGRNLSDVYTWDEIYERVHDGSFEDLYLGDYKTAHLVTDLYTRFTGSAFVAGTTYYEMGGTIIARTWTETQDAEPQSGKVYATKQIVEEDIDLMIAHFDYYYNMGVFDKTHHLILVPRKTGFKNKAAIHYDPYAIIGYINTDINQITLPCYAESLKTALNNHLQTINARLTSAVSTTVPSMFGAGFNGASTASADCAVYLQLMPETQLFGTAFGSSSAFEVGFEYNKLAVFNFINFHEEDTEHTQEWLRTLVYYEESYRILMQMQASSNGLTSGTAYSTARAVRPTMIFG
jgi:hypothetical protein